MICDFGFDWGFVRFCQTGGSEDFRRIELGFLGYE